jgi:hypothetical protein
MHRLLDHVKVSLCAIVEVPPTNTEVLSVGVVHRLRRAAQPCGCIPEVVYPQVAQVVSLVNALSLSRVLVEATC